MKIYKMGSFKKLPLLFSESQEEMVHFFNCFAEEIVSTNEGYQKLTGWIIRDVEIFRSGTYRGVDFTNEHLQEMADNFTTLKPVFEPVFKKDHSESVEAVVGYILAVRVQGDTLLADLHLTEWSAFDKIESKTWRYLSAEIYPPILAEEEFADHGISGHVLRGVAIVSVPKVKGLKGIILNSEIIPEDKSQEGGNIVNREQLLKMLAKHGITFSEEQAAALTVEQLEEALTAKFSELQGQGQGSAAGGAVPGAVPGAAASTGAGVQNFSEGAVVFSAAEFLQLNNEFSTLKGQVSNFSEEITRLKDTAAKNKVSNKVEALMKAGKVTPAEKAEVLAFAEALDDAAQEKYFATLEKRAAVIEFGESFAGGQGGSDDDDQTAVDEWFSRHNKTY